MRVRLGAVFAGLVAVLAAAAPAGAARFSTVPPGMTQEKVADFGGGCDGGGPSAVATDGTVHYFTVNGDLQKKQPQPADQRSVGGNVFGVAVAGGALYGTQPGCDERPPGLGEACNVARINPADANDTTPIADDVCGTAITASPDGRRLAVATENDIVTMTTDGGNRQTVPGPARALAWMGSTIYFVRPDGGISTTSGSVTGPVGARAIAAGTAALGLENQLIVATGTGVSILRDGRLTEIARSTDVVALATSGNVILAGKRPDAWVLRGRYTPEGPPPPAAAPVAPPPTRPAPAPPTPRAETITRAPRTPAPPPIAPAPAPPPVPPAPPAPLPVFVAQPSTVANPAMVPGQADPEAAYRLAAVALATAGGAASYAAGAATRKRRHAYGEVHL